MHLTTLPLEPRGLHGPTVVHREPRGAAVDDHAVLLIFIVQRQIHHIVHIFGRDAALTVIRG